MAIKCILKNKSDKNENVTINNVFLIVPGYTQIESFEFDEKNS